MMHRHQKQASNTEQDDRSVAHSQHSTHSAPGPLPRTQCPLGADGTGKAQQVASNGRAETAPRPPRSSGPEKSAAWTWLRHQQEHWVHGGPRGESWRATTHHKQQKLQKSQSVSVRELRNCYKHQQQHNTLRKNGYCCPLWWQKMKDKMERIGQTRIKALCQRNKLSNFIF